MFDRRLIQYFDWGLLFITLLISGIGLAVLYSAVDAGPSRQLHPLYYKQMVWLGVGFVLMFLAFVFNYRQLEKWGVWIYLFCILLLIAVHLFGKEAGGSSRWLSLGPLTLQPSEPVKLAVIILLARYYFRAAKPSGLTLTDLIIPMSVIVIPFLLVATQPDLGTAGIIFLISVTMTLFSKIHKRTLLCFIILGILLLPLGWEMLEPYQKERILTLVFPNKDPLGAGYHIRQSKIAVGSGMMMGKGYLQGTQKMLQFLPEQHTDFIFSVIAEEWGFLGSMGLLSFYLILILFGLNIARRCRDAFGTILAFGITSMLFWQVVINIGMVTGIMPVVGMPLPLISYGGSSIITSLTGIGILMNISMRRFMKE